MTNVLDDKGTILRSIGDAVIITDRDGNVTLMNPVAEKLTGWSEAEAMGNPLTRVFRIVNARTGRPAEDPVGRVIRSGKIAGLANHTQLIARGGSIHQIADSAAPVMDSEGWVGGVVLVFRDVTEEYRMREQVRRSEEFLSSVFESIQDGVSILDRDLSIIRVNRVMREWYAAHLPLEGKKCHACYQNAASPCEPCPSLRSLESGRTESEVVPGVPGSGVEWIELFSHPVRDPETGDTTAVVEFVRDITGRKRAEESLKTERRRLADVLEGTHVGSWEWNVSTGETVFNERWAEIIGYTLEEISPTTLETWMRFAHPEDLSRSSTLLEAHFRGETDYYECEARMRHKNGEWVWVLDRGRVAVWSEEGRPILMSGTHQDITERKRAQKELEDRERTLRTIIEHSNEVFYIHDIEQRFQYVSPTSAAILGYSP